MSMVVHEIKNKISVTFAFLTLRYAQGNDVLSPNVPATHRNVYKAYCLPTRTKFHRVRSANGSRAINISSILKLKVPTLFISRSYRYRD